MAQTEGDEDAFIGRRLKGRRRRPIDLSLGYYLNSSEDIPLNNEHANVDQSRRLLPSAKNNQDMRPNQQVGIVLGTVLKENQVIPKSKSSSPSLSQPSDPISVDRFLKSASKVNATRNYKQARKRKIKEKLLDDLNDSGDRQDSSGQVTSTVKPLKKAGRTRARRLAATRDLSVSGLRSRSIITSPQLLHHRWQPVKNVRTASSVDNRVDTGVGDGLSIKSNPPRELRVPLLPPGWKNQTPQPGPSIKVLHKPIRVKAIHDVVRSALSFEPIEEHDKKLDLWLGTGSHSTKRGAKQNAPFGRGVPPLTFSERLVSKGGQLSKETPESIFNVLKASKLSQNGGSVVSYPQQSEVLADAGLKRSAGQTNQNTRVPGQKLIHLGDMLGELRLSAKEFCHASGNISSPD